MGGEPLEYLTPYGSVVVSSKAFPRAHVTAAHAQRNRITLTVSFDTSKLREQPNKVQLIWRNRKTQRELIYELPPKRNQRLKPQQHFVTTPLSKLKHEGRWDASILYIFSNGEMSHRVKVKDQELRDRFPMILPPSTKNVCYLTEYNNVSIHYRVPSLCRSTLHKIKLFLTRLIR